MSRLLYERAVVSILMSSLVLILAACGSTPAPRAARSTTGPSKRAALKHMAPLAYSDALVASWDRMDKVLHAHKARLKSLFTDRSQANRRKILDSSAKVLSVHRAISIDFARLLGPKSWEAHTMAQRYRGFLRKSGQLLEGVSVMIRILAANRHANWGQMNQVIAKYKPMLAQVATAREMLNSAMCDYVKAYGVKQEDPRWWPCNEDANFWVLGARRIETAACACTTLACASLQEGVLREYLDLATGVRVTKSVGKKVATAILAAQSCITKTQIRLKPKQAQPPRPRP